MNREEFTPYGESSFGGFARKRYRFTGKERDEESGLSYHGARYYSPGIARWTEVDPQQSNFPEWGSFCYASSNPLIFTDPRGSQPELPEMINEYSNNSSELARRTAEESQNLATIRSSIEREAAFRDVPEDLITMNRQADLEVVRNKLAGLEREAQALNVSGTALENDVTQYKRDYGPLAGGPSEGIYRTSTNPEEQLATARRTNEATINQARGARSSADDLIRTAQRVRGGGGGGGGGGGPVKRAPSLRGRLLEGLKVAGDVALVIDFGYTTIKQSRDPELQGFSRGVGERIEELSGSKILGAFVNAYVHVHASGIIAAHEMAKLAVVEPIRNAVKAYSKSPVWTIVKNTSPIGWIGTYSGWF